MEGFTLMKGEFMASEYVSKPIKEYIKDCHLQLDLPEMQIGITRNVYPPKLDSFLLAKSLLKFIKAKMKVLEIGTGSGFLAILAALKGTQVVATDVDEDSVKCAKYNAFLNHVNLDIRIGNLFESIKPKESFNVLIGNLPTLPRPLEAEQYEYVALRVSGGYNGRKYLDPFIEQTPLYLTRPGYFLTVHSNFANIEATEERLTKAGFNVTKIEYEYPLGKHSSQVMDYLLKKFSKNCHPFRKSEEWYQRIAVFKALLK